MVPDNAWRFKGHVDRWSAFGCRSCRAHLTLEAPISEAVLVYLHVVGSSVFSIPTPLGTVMTNKDVGRVNEILHEIRVIIWQVKLKVIYIESILLSGVFVM
jgi:hypothetical protein